MSFDQFNPFKKPPLNKLFKSGSAKTPDTAIPNSTEHKTGSDIEGMKHKFMMLMLALGIAVSADASSPAPKSFENYNDMQTKGKTMSMQVKHQMESMGVDTVKFPVVDSKGNIKQGRVFKVGQGVAYMESDSLSGTSLEIIDKDDDGVADELVLTYGGKTAETGKANNMKPEVHISFNKDATVLARTKVHSNIDLSIPLTDATSAIDQSKVKTVQEVMIFDKTNEKLLTGLSNAEDSLSQTAQTN